MKAEKQIRKRKSEVWGGRQTDSAEGGLYIYALVSKEPGEKEAQLNRNLCPAISHCSSDASNR